MAPVFGYTVPLLIYCMKYLEFHPRIMHVLGIQAAAFAGFLYHEPPNVGSLLS